MRAGRFVLSVFLPSIVLPWEGFTSTGTEKIPPILYLGPFTALFTVVSLWVRSSSSVVLNVNAQF